MAASIFVFIVHVMNVVSAPGMVSHCENVKHTLILHHSEYEPLGFGQANYEAQEQTIALEP